MDFPDLNLTSLDKDEYQPSNPVVADGNQLAKSKTVVLWGSEDILIRSIKSFLTSKNDWQVVSLSNKQDIEALIQAVESTHATMVILQKEKKSDSTLFPLRLVKDIPSLRVIMLCLEDNSIEIFSKQEIWVKNVSDLTSIFDDES